MLICDLVIKPRAATSCMRPKRICISEMRFLAKFTLANNVTMVFCPRPPGGETPGEDANGHLVVCLAAASSTTSRAFQPAQSAGGMPCPMVDALPERPVERCCACSNVLSNFGLGQVGMQVVTLLSIADVVKLTSLSKATIYRLVKAGEFPKPVTISPGRKAWRSDEIASWIQARKKAG
jgi:prophage regulatory protein